MKDAELQAIAKAIRNAIAPTTWRKDLASKIAAACVEQDQFFNKKKFLTIATMELEEDNTRKEQNMLNNLLKQNESIRRRSEEEVRAWQELKEIQND